jgi:hypothetical protein
MSQPDEVDVNEILFRPTRDVSKITAQGARCPEELEQMTGR